MGGFFSSYSYLLFDVSGTWKHDELEKFLIMHHAKRKTVQSVPLLGMTKFISANEERLTDIEEAASACHKPIIILRKDKKNKKRRIHWRDATTVPLQSVLERLQQNGYYNCRGEGNKLVYPAGSLHVTAVYTVLKDCLILPQPSAQVQHAPNSHYSKQIHQQLYSGAAVITKPYPFQQHQQQKQQNLAQWQPNAQQERNSPQERQPLPSDAFTDEILVDEPKWNYLILSHSSWLADLKAKGKCVWKTRGCGSDHYIQMSGTQVDVESSINALIDKIKQLDITIITRRCESQSECEKLYTDITNKKLCVECKDPLTLCISGPKIQLNQALEPQKRQLLSHQTTEQAVVHRSERVLSNDNKFQEAVLPKNVNSNNLGSPAMFSASFLANSLRVEVIQRNLVDEKVTAIVNPANIHLNHGGGAAKAIADAAGRDLLRECEQVLSRHPRNRLKVSEPVHTTAGNLRPNVKYVIHVAGPRIDQYNGDKRKVYEMAQKAFYNSMIYANDKISAESMALPAIGSGIYGLDKELVAHEAFTALEKFIGYIFDNPQVKQNLKLIRFTNFDEETTEIFKRVFQERYNGKKALTGRGRSNSYGTRAGISTQYKTRSKSSSPSHVRPDAQLKIFNSDAESRGAAGKRGSSVRKSNISASNYDNLKQRHEGNVDGDDSDSGSTGDGTPLLAKKGGREVSNEKLTARDKSSEQKRALKLSSGDVGAAAAANADCVICLSPITNPKTLDCGHTFCKGCIMQSFKKCQPKCPSCGRLFGAMNGNQPDGLMKIQSDPTVRLAGHEQYGAIIIQYEFPDGIQGPEHPNPGQRYTGTRRTAYLPDSIEGQRVCNLLKKAFDQRMLFTVGRSVTTGRDNAIVWNDIHQKTAKHGQYGYPDPTYLDRVREELAAKGVTDERHTEF